LLVPFWDPDSLSSGFITSLNPNLITLALRAREKPNDSTRTTASAELCMLIEMWFIGVRIRMLGIVRFKKQTDGTRRRMLRADPDVEWC
jgi:hypothetical protein